MERSISDFHRFYESIARPISETDAAVQILDIGCGTGLELEAIFKKAPNALVTALDLSPGMLRELRKRYEVRLDQLTVIRESYLEVPLGEGDYDYAVGVMTLHHLLPARKKALYRRIRRALNRGGLYIEGDWVVSLEEERRYLSEYRERCGHLETSDEGGYHIDVPLSLETEKHLLLKAGFSSVDVIWQANGNGVYVARG
ncbi:MAG: class I SAM-dependent methyltransferase [Chloroflexota bacterium]|nr:class I SAM-dependent methyltransferase [Chloroflexota bacterium]